MVFNALKLVIGILAEFSIVKGSAYKTIFFFEVYAWWVCLKNVKSEFVFEERDEIKIYNLITLIAIIIRLGVNKWHLFAVFRGHR
tara:strand:+ start:405 stop:659 length:255 start_codon:yes stop_codon:yes gene_type:complete